MKSKNSGADAPSWRIFGRRKARKKIPNIDAIALFVAFFALGVSVYQTVQSTEALRDQQISAAWQIVATKGGGSTGKQYALQTLMKISGKVANVDFGCEVQGGKFVADGARGLVCEGGVNLDDVDLSRATAGKPEALLVDVDLEGVSISGGRFNENYIAYAKFDRVTAITTKFGGAVIDNTSFKGAFLIEADFQGAQFGKVDFSEALLGNVDFTGAVVFSDIYGLNISGTLFCTYHGCAKGISEDLLKQAYYVESDPPIGLERAAETLKYETILRCSDDGAGCEEVYIADIDGN